MFNFNYSLKNNYQSFAKPCISYIFVGLEGIIIYISDWIAKETTIKS